MVRRRPLLRAAAVAGGAFYLGRRRRETRQREADEKAREAALERLRTARAAKVSNA